MVEASLVNVGGGVHVKISVAYLVLFVINTFESYINYGNCDLWDKRVSGEINKTYLQICEDF